MEKTRLNSGSPHPTLLRCRRLPLLRFSLLLLLLCPVIALPAQHRKSDRRFDGGVVLGFNASQIDGDYQFGYRKKGLSGGIRAEAAFSPKLYLSVELLYSQRGAKPQSDPRKSFVDMELDYMEAPILMNFRMTRSSETTMATFFQLGASYGRMMRYKVSEDLFGGSINLKANQSSFKEISNHFSNNDLSLVFGGSVYFSSHLSLNVRGYYSMNELFDSASIPEKTNRSLRSYHLNLQFAYAVLGVDRLRERRRR